MRPVSATANRTTAQLIVRTAGIGTTVAEAARLRVPPTGTVTAKADTAAMTATRTATIPRPDVDWSISSVGLSAGGYNNHVFWDAETTRGSGTPGRAPSPVTR